MNKSQIILKLILGSIGLLSSSIVMATESSSPVFIELGTGGAINSDTRDTTEAGLPSSLKAKHQTTAIAYLSLGYKYSPDIKLAWNFSYLPKWRDSYERVDYYYHANLSSITSTLNGYYNFSTVSLDNVTPYIMAGAGLNRNEVGDVEEYVHSELSSKFYGNSKFNFMWRLGAGLNYEINERSFINLGYNFASLGNVKTKVSGVSTTNSKVETMVIGVDRLNFKKIYSHQFLIGVGVNF